MSAESGDESVWVKQVVAEGVGAGTDRAKARDDAIADAQRRAVEQAVGLFLKSDTLVENAALVEDTIYRHSEGYIHTYEVVSEGYRSEEFRVKIRAQVRTGKIQEDLDDIWARLSLAGRPRIIVAVGQPQRSDVPDLAQSILVDKLVGVGFKVLDEGQLAQARWKTALKLIRSGKAKEADILALQDVADVVVVGTATYRSLGKPDPQLDVYSCEAAVSARAVRTDTAEVIASARGATGTPRPAFRQDQAVEEALRTAAEDWVSRNSGALVRAAVDPAKEYALVLTGCRKHSQVDALQSQLRGLRFVRQVRLLAFDKGVAQVEVEFVGAAGRLAGEMERFKSPAVSVEGVTARTIRVHVKR